MKKTWICKWRKGERKGLRKFDDYQKANAFIRKLISREVDLSELVGDLRRFGDYQFNNALADFLVKYVKDSSFPHSENDIDSIYDYEDDFPEDEFFDCDLDDDETFIEIDSRQITYIRNGYNFSSNFVMYEPILENDRLRDELMASYNDENNFLKENPQDLADSFSVELKLVCKEDWGFSAHPIMVLQVLQAAESPMKIEEIVQCINARYTIVIERKAVGRHIDLLKRLDYKIQHCKDGYFLGE